MIDVRATSSTRVSAPIKLPTRHDGPARPRAGHVPRREGDRHGRGRLRVQHRALDRERGTPLDSSVRSAPRCCFCSVPACECSHRIRTLLFPRILVHSQGAIDTSAHSRRSRPRNSRSPARRLVEAETAQKSSRKHGSDTCQAFPRDPATRHSRVHIVVIGAAVVVPRSRRAPATIAARVPPREGTRARTRRAAIMRLRAQPASNGALDHA